MSELKTAFVTGATGFLGGHLSQQLVEQGWEVTALVRSIPKNPINGVNYVVGDLLNPTSIQSQMPNQLDAVFHVASDTNTWQKNNTQQTAVNIQGTENIISATKAKQTQSLIYVSSIVTWGVDHSGLVNTTENDPQHGAQSWVNYVITKSQAEQLVLTAGDSLRVIIANPTHIIGPGDQNNWIRLFKLIIKNALPTIPQGAGSFADVRDVARGLILANEKGQHGEHYILGGNNLTFPDFIEAVCQAWQLDIKKKVLPKAVIKMVAHLQSWLGYLTGSAPDITPEALLLISHRYAVDSEKAKSELGYTITPLSDSLDVIAEDLKTRGILPCTDG